MAEAVRLARRSGAAASALRRQQTDAERQLWFELRDRRLLGAKFRRQAPIGPLIVDLLCLEANLIVEVDGGQHTDENPGRQRWLETQGHRVVRSWIDEVLQNRDGVLTAIAEALTPRLSRGKREQDSGLKRLPLPPREGRGEGGAT